VYEEPLQKDLQMIYNVFLPVLPHGIVNLHQKRQASLKYKNTNVGAFKQASQGIGIKKQVY